MKPNLLQDARVYLSGPMDFVASREDEKKKGWRHRVADFLRALGVTIFDPWFKPEIHGMKEYGIEDEKTTGKRAEWSFEPGAAGAAKRAACVWWTRAILSSPIVQRTFTVSARRTKSSCVVNSASRCYL